MNRVILSLIGLALTACVPSSTSTPPTSGSPAQAVVLYGAGQRWQVEAETASENGGLTVLGVLTLENNPVQGSAPGVVRAVSPLGNGYFSANPEGKVVFGFLRQVGGVVQSDRGQFCLIGSIAAAQQNTEIEGLYFEGTLSDFQPIYRGDDLSAARVCRVSRLS